MSDGPHKSLPMQPHWKKLAERAANPSYTSYEVDEALLPPLMREFREAPLSEIRAILGGGNQMPLFNGNCAAQLDALRHACRGSPAGSMLIDCAIEANANGMAGDAALHYALRNALGARAWAGCRQIEEHQYRVEPRNGAKVRGCLNEARMRCPYDTLASELMFDPKSNKIPRILKRTGIDEGPPL
jgi:hypothetical protein